MVPQEIHYKRHGHRASLSYRGHGRVVGGAPAPRRPSGRVMEHAGQPLQVGAAAEGLAETHGGAAEAPQARFRRFRVGDRGGDHPHARVPRAQAEEDVAAVQAAGEAQVHRRARAAAPPPRRRGP